MPTKQLRLAFYIVVGLVSLMAVDTLRWLVQRPRSPAAVQEVAMNASGKMSPYTVVVAEHNLNQAENRSSEGGRYTIALRSDGATAMVRESYRPVRVLSQRTLHFSNGQRLTIDDVREVFMESRRAQARLPESANNCLLTLRGRTETVVGEENVSGYRAVKIRIEDQYVPATYWRVPALSCASVRAEVQLTNVGILSTKTPLSIEEGEPAEWIFEVQARYKRVSRAEFDRGVIRGVEDAEGLSRP
jgi:hypothetical protein